MPGTNTLAYDENSTITAVKSFVTLVPGQSRHYGQVEQERRNHDRDHHHGGKNFAEKQNRSFEKISKYTPKSFLRSTP